MTARKDAVESTRERILRAAYEEWSRRSYDQVSLQTIADTAGVSRQTVARQFGTKDALAFAVVDWQKPLEDDLRATEAGDLEAAVTRLVGRYESMGDANVRMLELEGRVPAIDYLLQVARDGHRAWVERTLLPDVSVGERAGLTLALYAATDVTLWKLLRRDLRQDPDVVVATVLRLVRGVLYERVPHVTSEGEDEDEED